MTGRTSSDPEERRGFLRAPSSPLSIVASSGAIEAVASASVGLGSAPIEGSGLDSGGVAGWNSKPRSRI